MYFAKAIKLKAELLHQFQFSQGPSRLKNLLRLFQVNPSLLSQGKTGDRGVQDLFRLGVPNGDADKMPLVVADGQGGEQDSTGV